METTLNSQLTTHNSRSYSPPHITVVEFKVEHCFNSFGPAKFGDFHSRWDVFEKSSYSTGSDEVVDFTYANGDFGRGAWDGE